MSLAFRAVRLFVVLATSVAVLTASALVVAPRVAKLVGAHVSDHATISLEPLSERSYVYDRFGDLLGTLVNEQNRVQVRLDQISEPMVETVIAIEDEHFYSHNGVNVRSIVRAFSANLEQGGVQQGGSTITQQLVKNSIVGTDQNLVPEDAGGGPGGRAREGDVQAGDPRALPEHHLLRQRCLRRAGRGRALLQHQRRATSTGRSPRCSRRSSATRTRTTRSPTPRWPTSGGRWCSTSWSARSS